MWIMLATIIGFTAGWKIRGMFAQRDKNLKDHYE